MQQFEDKYMTLNQNKNENEYKVSQSNAELQFQDNENLSDYSIILKNQQDQNKDENSSIKSNLILDISDSVEFLTLNESSNGQQTSTKSDQTFILNQSQNQNQILSNYSIDQCALEHENYNKSNEAQKTLFETLLQFERLFKEQNSNNQQQPNQKMNFKQRMQLKEYEKKCQEYMASLEPGDFRLVIEKRFQNNQTKQYQFPRKFQ
ncbi:hypothetical protein TTHERM_00836710 (macronuclear) [Tetrahymena thermophila SB210]|uniref:Uncharacterized protein n=1 Tax=Tetrahymena thermophila (strain SB210) TaxID=312017 RepID=I7MMJ9_TETTS|nr:hypothetical protein TTHERM_00836710 [Tetrahymena thermophila SB210]EAS04999.2 hypothetical protein TTHERM_00836710 [Tetrahymena thermophila SB210]|eukprot:XP_001025244.2 hypothetical protein TTHERM_00836710 [Tetrahymena thermophila SB210]